MAISPSRLSTPDGNTLVFEKIEGASPGVVFLHGLKSDRHGNKANALASYCSKRGYGFLCYDMYGHGESSGRFEDGGPSRWRDDAVAVLDKLTRGPQILVGSSMGGWVMLLAALARPDRIAGLIGIAVAPDFTNMPMELSDAQRDQLARDGAVNLESSYIEEPMHISRHLIEDGNRNLLLGGPIAVTCPVRLLHGQCDDSVPWQRSMRVAECLAGGDVETILIKDGDHRLSRDGDLALLGSTLDLLVERVRP
ncbi:MAG: alpha/beta hydrolase [Rhodospirillaceae bacterium]|nr:MAG: alpha/beta hydrolase [Rhodospirillaceae bacterium]